MAIYLLSMWSLKNTSPKFGKRPSRLWKYRIVFSHHSVALQACTLNISWLSKLEKWSIPHVFLWFSLKISVTLCEPNVNHCFEVSPLCANAWVCCYIALYVFWKSVPSLQLVKYQERLHCCYFCQEGLCMVGQCTYFDHRSIYLYRMIHTAWRIVSPHMCKKFETRS